MHENGTKTTPVFLSADGEASWLLLLCLVSSLSGGIALIKNLTNINQCLTDPANRCLTDF